MALFSRQQKMHVLHIGLSPQSQVDLRYAEADESSDQGEAHSICSLFEIGAPSIITTDLQVILKLPPQFSADLKEALSDTPKTEPLWLRFIKPYGYLGAQPWESELIRLLSRPVLRLPALFERPPEKRQVLEAAICYDASPRASPEKVGKQIETIAAALAISSPRPETRIHIFTSETWHSRAREIQFNSRIVLHDPAQAPAAQGPLFHKWASWLVSKLEGRSLDAVHMVCRAESTDIGPILSVSGAPDVTGQTPICSVDTLEFGSFLTRVGAWMAIFTPPPGDEGAAALALAADALPQLRPTV